MRIRFSKMHGLGNDFVVIDAITQKVNISPERARKLADRHFGVGCDQVLIVEPPQSPSADFCYRIFNHDGSEVENCGNGARCFALFVHERGLTAKNDIRVETAGGEIMLHVLPDNQVAVNMGIPVLAPAKIPFKVDRQAATYPLLVEGETLEISAVSMGNPHAVTIVENLAAYPVHKTGALIENHPQFPARVNAGFMEIISPNKIGLRVFERGVGETLACGTGACAAVVAGRVQNKLANSVTVSLPGGELMVAWEGEGKPVMMTGPATTVFHGQIKV